MNQIEILSNLYSAQIEQTKKLLQHIDKPKVFVDCWFALNVGDDLFLHILISRYPNVLFFISTLQPYSEIFRHNPNVICETETLAWGYGKSLADVSFYDALVRIGGSMFLSSLVEGLYQRNYFMIHKFIESGKKVFITGANFDRDYVGLPRSEKSFHELFSWGGGDAVSKSA